MPRKTAIGITPRQKETLQWIKTFIASNGLPPTIREIAAALDIKSSTTFHLVNSLCKKGYLKRGPLGARSLTLETPPQENKPNKLNQDTAHQNKVAIPLLGIVAAGHPILAEENKVGEVYVDSKISNRGKCFALQIQGDSMVEAGIRDGDIVIVRQQPVAQDKEIIVALLGDQATVKELSIKGDSIELRPKNRAYRNIPIDHDDDFHILGKVISTVKGHGPHVKRRN